MNIAGFRSASVLIYNGIDKRLLIFWPTHLYCPYLWHPSVIWLLRITRYTRTNVVKIDVAVSTKSLLLKKGKRVNDRDASISWRRYCRRRHPDAMPHPLAYGGEAKRKKNGRSSIFTEQNSFSTRESLFSIYRCLYACPSISAYVPVST